MVSNRTEVGRRRNRLNGKDRTMYEIITVLHFTESLKENHSWGLVGFFLILKDLMSNI